MKRRKFVLAMGSAVAATRARASLASSANEQIRVACIGTGGRCRHLMQALGKISGAKVVGICDVWDEALKAAKPLAAPDAFVEKDYRRTLERKDVDAVLIATPDHWHVPLVIAALEAGKDVYCEKPLTHKISEATQLLDVHQKHPRVVQVGTQQRSMPHLQEARELVRSGKLGQVFKADLSWNRNIGRGIGQPKVDPNSVDWKMFLGNAPDQPFNAFRMREWRWIWDFGGGLFTDLMVHWLDVVHWFCEVETPTLALSFGDWIHAKGHWETPDTVQT
ncbi:MAG TPA: Gfo/Idh/MocA family oxidoreductase, partial [Planctomycetia bacterium]|nr:Gfo/Idh/MocA family oxidoreductase [Planctomycetia bacterium]